jgi:tetratricopeptide (TPR) repeat protein
MHIQFSTNKKMEMFTSDEAQAESELAQVLQTPSLTLAELGELALKFFQSAKYSLAAMVFAKWTEHEPENPEPWTNLGYALLKQNKVNDALTLTEHALALRSNYFPAMANLCDVFLQLGKFDQQLDIAQRCVAIQPNSCIAHNNLGTALWHNGKVAEAKRAFQESFRLDPKYFEARLNLGKLMSDEGQHAEATAEFENLLLNNQLDRATREVVEFYLGFEYLNAGRLQEGWRFYERGFSASVPPLLARNPSRTFSVPRWQGEVLQHHHKLLIWREQGIGDELRFLSLLQKLNVDQSHWIIETDRRLVEVLQRSFPLAVVRVEKSATEDLLAHEGYHIPVGSLPDAVMSVSQQFPNLDGYLQVSPWQVGRFSQRLSAYADKTKIGICWRSHKTNAVRNKKYSALKDWHDLLSLPNTCFVSLQYGDAEQEIAEVEQALGISILRWPDVDLKNDLEAVLGIMHNLDHVVSTSTAVVPLAGALGRPTVFLGHASWILLGQSNHYPWYSSVTPVLVPRSEPVSSGIGRVAERFKHLH